MVYFSEKTKILLIILLFGIILYFDPIFIFLPVLGYFLYKKMNSLIDEYYLKKANEEIPDFLYQVSTYISYLDLIESIGKTKTKYLKSKLLYKRLKESNDPKSVINQFSEEYKYFKKIKPLFMFTLKTGKESKKIIKKIAEILKKQIIIEKEFEIGILIEKYTLLFGGGILIPLILGFVFQFSSSLDFSELGESDIDLNLLYWANIIYLINYSFIIGIFLEKKNKMIIIFLLLILTLGCFNFAINYSFI